MPLPYRLENPGSTVGKDSGFLKEGKCLLKNFSKMPENKRTVVHVSILSTPMNDMVFVKF